VIDLFYPPKIKPKPTRKIIRADVEPPPLFTSAGPELIHPRNPNHMPKPLRPESELTDPHYAARREYYLAKARARYANLSPEEKAARKRRAADLARKRREAL
jgi:hypothetical protein